MLALAYSVKIGVIFGV